MTEGDLLLVLYGWSLVSGDLAFGSHTGDFLLGGEGHGAYSILCKLLLIFEDAIFIFKADGDQAIDYVVLKRNDVIAPQAQLAIATFKLQVVILTIDLYAVSAEVYYEWFFLF